MIEQYTSYFQYVKELKKCLKCISIKDSTNLSNYIEQIKQCEQNNQQYQIQINFFYKNSSLDQKMKVIETINKLNINHKIGIIWIEINDNNPINEQII